MFKTKEKYSKELLYNEYVIKEKSISLISKELKRGKDFISKQLKEFGIEIRKTLTESERKLSSNRRIKFLNDNPDKHPWRFSNRFKSVPCQKVKDYLKSQNIQFIEEYKAIKERSFSIDIAFPDKKIAIEINGNQHYNKDGSLKPYYQERHNLLESNGWIVYELHYSICFNLEKFDTLIPNILNYEKKVEFDYGTYRPKEEKNKNSINNKIIKFFSKEELEKALEECYHCKKKTSEKLGITVTSLYSKIRRMKIISNVRNFKIKKEKRLNENPNWRNAPKINNRKVERPSKEILEKEINNRISYVQLGKKYGVSDNAIKKWTRSYNIILPIRNLINKTKPFLNKKLKI